MSQQVAVAQPPVTMTGYPKPPIVLVAPVVAPVAILPPQLPTRPTPVLAGGDVAAAAQAKLPLDAVDALGNPIPRPKPKARGKPRKCQYTPGVCPKLAQGKTMFCARHGGGRRCQKPECTKLAQGSTQFCACHGGGRRCHHPDGCDKSAAGGTQFCKAHGGGKRCVHPSCPKSAQGSTPLCMAHGGGRRCHAPDCNKIVISTTNFCKQHGGTRRCSVEGCEQPAHANRTLCNSHAGANLDGDVPSTSGQEPIPGRPTPRLGTFMGQRGVGSCFTPLPPRGSAAFPGGVSAAEETAADLLASSFGMRKSADSSQGFKSANSMFRTLPTSAAESEPQPPPSQWPNFQGKLPPGTTAVPSAALAEFLVEMGALGENLKRNPITWRRVHTAFEEYVVTRGLYNSATGRTKCDAMMVCLLNTTELTPRDNLSSLLKVIHWVPKLPASRKAE